MIETIGDLSERGFSFFLDEKLNIEIPQDATINVWDNNEVEFYLGVKYRTEADKRYGEIFIFTEEYTYLMLDIVEENDGVFSRAYDEIEYIDIEYIYDGDMFFKNMIIERSSESMFSIGKLFAGTHEFVGAGSGVLDGNYITDVKYYEIFFPGYQNSGPFEYSYPVDPIAYPGDTWTFVPEGINLSKYNFYTHFFPDEDDIYDTIYNQYYSNKDILWYHRDDFYNNGWSYRHAETIGDALYVYDYEFNYIHDIYPENRHVLDYRWKYGGFDINYYEMKMLKQSIFERFDEWYSESDYSCVAINKKIRETRTDIGGVDVDINVDKNINNLISLVGEPTYSYSCGGGYVYDGAMFGVDYFNDDTRVKVISSENLQDKTYDEIVDSSFSDKYINGVEIAPGHTSYGMPSKDAFYSIAKTGGLIGGQDIFRSGVGNQYEYFNSLDSYLNRRKISIFDFFETHHHEVQDRGVDLKEATIVETNINVKDFTEFYDKDHKAPFDNIYYYCPIVISDGDYTISKSRVDTDEYGNETIIDLPDEILPAGSFMAPINKDEFVRSISCRAVNVFVSNYTKIKIKIKFKETVGSNLYLKMRMLNSDFTFLTTREIEYNV